MMTILEQLQAFQNSGKNKVPSVPVIKKKPRKTDEILAFLAKNGPSFSRDISLALNVSVQSIYQYMNELYSFEEVYFVLCKGRGKSPQKKWHIMTRINLIPPSELTDAHLGAEYRELPRIFKLVREAQLRGELPDDKRNPKHYVLGTGHCRFFYPRLGFLVERYALLVAECRARGRIVNYPSADIFLDNIDQKWFGSYVPTINDINLSRKRISERLMAKY